MCHPNFRDELSEREEGREGGRKGGRDGGREREKEEKRKGTKTSFICVITFSCKVNVSFAVLCWLFNGQFP